jgi:hypothetical protein
VAVAMERHMPQAVPQAEAPGQQAKRHHCFGATDQQSPVFRSGELALVQRYRRTGHYRTERDGRMVFFCRLVEVGLYGDRRPTVKLSSVVSTVAVFSYFSSVPVHHL